MNSFLKQTISVLSIVACGFLTGLGQTPNPIAPTDAKPAQTTTEPKKSSIKFQVGKLEVDGKTVSPDRKRFYLIRGSLPKQPGDPLMPLLDKIAAAPAVSPDCYYANLRKQGQQISDQFLCWLKKNDCESPFCRDIKTREEALLVPEFAKAYDRSFREYGRSPLLALKWLTTNLDRDLRDGYYLQQRKLTKDLVDLARFYGQETTKAKTGAAKPNDGFQSVMTDRLGNAFFVDIDLVPAEGKKTETYLISNLVPLFIGNTGYVWVCEAQVDSTKQITFNLKNELKKCKAISKPITETCASPDCKNFETAPAVTGGATQIRQI